MKGSCLSIAERFPEVCVVYIQRISPGGEPEILLGRKKTGLGRGHLVAPGGKIEAGETAEQAAVREVREEVGLEISGAALRLIGELTYPFPHHPEWSQKSWAFMTDDPGGQAFESEELAPVWVTLSELPLDQMWDDAKYWLPDSLRGVVTRATFSFGADGLTVESSNHPGFRR